MKYILLCCSLWLCSNLCAQTENSQSVWQISVQPKKWIGVPIADSNCLSITAKDKQKAVMIAFTKVEPTVLWHRFIVIMDSARRELLRKPLTNNQLLLSKAMLRKLNKGNPLYINTIAIPADERKARAVRVRTVLLTKLVWIE